MVAQPIIRQTINHFLVKLLRFFLLHLTWLTGRDANGSPVSQMSQSGYPTAGAKNPEARDLGRGRDHRNVLLDDAVRTRWSEMEN